MELMHLCTGFSAVPRVELNAVEESKPWELLRHGDVVLRDMVSGHGKDSLMVEVDDPSGLFQS